MTDEKRKILDKINGQILRLRNELLDRFPSVHEIEDGIIIRFFTDWDNCADDDEIKYKKIINRDDPDESIVFFYLPKGSLFDLKQRFHIGCMTCLNGVIEVTVNGEIRHLESNSKICVNSADVQGRAFENTYLVVTSNKKEWNVNVRKHVESNY
jgi:hypothetical protein